MRLLWRLRLVDHSLEVWKSLAQSSDEGALTVGLFLVFHGDGLYRALLTFPGN